MSSWFCAMVAFNSRSDNNKVDGRLRLEKDSEVQGGGEGGGRNI